VTLNVEQVGISGDEVVQRLLDGEPSIAVAPESATTFYLNPYTLQAGEEKIVQEQLVALLQLAARVTARQHSAVR
jgi:hypothetical protein